MLKMQDFDLHHQRVLIRLDLNVPIQNGNITSDARIKAALPTIQYAVKQQARVIVMSHLGRPKEGVFDAAFSLKPIAMRLSTLLGQNVELMPMGLPEKTPLPGQVILSENTRFNPGEKSNDPALSKKLAALCDIFVMDAFGSCHRAEASTAGVSAYAKVACAGPLVLQELDSLNRVLQNPKRPLLALVGGSKVSTKLHILEALIRKVDILMIGGGIANTFLAATGVSIGKSLYEPEQQKEAVRLLELAQKLDVSLPLPMDVVVSETLSQDAVARVVNLKEILISETESIFDIGPKTIADWVEKITQAGTILWNGPVGAFEYAPFEIGTQKIASAIAASPAFTVAGGGDTIAALSAYQLASKIGYISTGGGAFLEFLAGKKLPALEILESKQ